MVYRERNGKRIRETTNTNDWHEAQRKLRERLQARDDKILDVDRKGEQLQFTDWVDFFLENYSKPPIRAEKTLEANERASVHLKEAFRQRPVGEITADDIDFTFGGDFRFAFSLRPLLESFRKIGLSRQPYIRNCGFFDLC